MNQWQNIFNTFFNLDSMLATLPQMLEYGLWNTLILALISTAIGIAIGLILAVMGISENRWIRLPARVYTDILRGLPAIVTILLIGQGLSSLLNPITHGNPYPLGILALSMIAGAYIGEIFRSGIQSIDRGQHEAARALGMTRAASLLRVVIPQGIRRVLPALVNQFIGIVKDSSLVYFLGLLTAQRELFRVGEDAAVNTGNLSPLVLAGIFYLIITVPLTHLVNVIDRRLSTGKRVAAQPDAADLEIRTTIENG